MSQVTREIMQRAKGLIQRNGWARGDEEAFDPDRQAGYCVATACVAACSKAELDAGHERALVLHFKAANGIDPYAPIADWNDAPGRTKAEMLAAFDKAIATGAESAGWSARPTRTKRLPRQPS
jgi:NAD-dependent dihydropyrimidine dehydrogenase PreA subunit